MQDGEIHERRFVKGRGSLPSDGMSEMPRTRAGKDKKKDVGSR